MSENYTGRKIKDTYMSILHLGEDMNIYNGTGSIVLSKNLIGSISQSIEFAYTSSNSYSNVDVPPTFFSVCVGENPCGIYSSGSFTQKEYVGLCIKQFPPKQSPSIYSKLSSFTFGNLVGIIDDFDITSYHKLKEINLPTLKYVMGNFKWDSSENIERCNVPVLEYIGKFSPIGGSVNMTSIDLPLLTNCCGDFSPASMSFISMSIDSLQYIGGNFYPHSLSNLSILSGSIISIGGNFNPTNCPSVGSMTFNNLKYIHGDFTPSKLQSCADISFNTLEYVGGNFSPTSMSVVLDNIGNQFPVLTFIEGSLTLIGLESCSSVSFNSLSTISGSYSISNMDNLLNIINPNLKNIILGQTISNNPTLTTVSLPIIEKIENGIHYYNCSNLSDINMGSSLLSLGTGDCVIADAALSPTSVENILQSLSRLDGTLNTILWGSGRTVDLTGGTSAGVLLLTPTAISSRDILLARGVAVNLNL